MINRLCKICATCLVSFSMHSTALAVTDAAATTISPDVAKQLDPDTKEKIDIETKNLESSRVIACAVHFPNDSVKFDESHVLNCFKNAKLESISYVHVIATASQTGSTDHNLYLSNRRAGAIEAFINNRYPNLSVHAFGGGINPKFGKVARIFLVENATPNEIAPGIQVASAGNPEVVEKLVSKTQYVTKVELRDRPKEDIHFYADGGIAKTDLSEHTYNYGSFAVSKLMQINYLSIGQLKLGLRFRSLQSDVVADILSYNATVAKNWDIYSIWGGKIFYEQSLEAGQMEAVGQDVEYGGTGKLGMRFKDIQIYTVGSVSNHIQSAGLGLTANI